MSNFNKLFFATTLLVLGFGQVLADTLTKGQELFADVHSCGNWISSDSKTVFRLWTGNGESDYVDVRGTDLGNGLWSCTVSEDNVIKVQLNRRSSDWNTSWAWTSIFSVESGKNVLKPNENCDGDCNWLTATWYNTTRIYATPSTMTYTNSASWDESKTYYANIKIGDSEWLKRTMTKTDYEYNGEAIYTTDFYSVFGGVHLIQFQIYDGETFKGQKVFDKTDPDPDWTHAGCITNMSDKIYNGTSWLTFGRDITIYAVPEAEEYDLSPAFSVDDYMLLANVKVGSVGNEWLASWPIFDKTDYTYDGKWIYKATVWAKYNVIIAIQFHEQDKGGSASHDYYDCAPTSEYSADDIDGKICLGGESTSSTWIDYATTITLDDNGGTGGSSSVEATIGSSTLGAITAPTHASGYTFVGYYSAAVGGVRVIDASCNLVANVSGYTDATGNWIHTELLPTLYAKWIVNIPQTSAGTYIPIGTIPATSGDKTPASGVTLVGCQVDGNYGAEAYTSYTVGSTNGNPMSITISLNATEAGNYLFSFKSGHSQGTAEVSLSLKNSSDEVIWNNGGNNVSISNTGSWALTEAHTFLLGDLAAGTYTLTITGVSKSGSYYGNFGNFCFHTPTTLPMPDSESNLLDVDMATYDGLSPSGNGLNGISLNSYADEMYMYISDAGYFQVYAGYGFATTGTDQFTITITDLATGTAEVNAKNYTLTSSMRYIMKDRITTGWKKIRLDHPSTPSQGSFRLEKMYFIPVQTMPVVSTDSVNVRLATVSDIKIDGNFLTQIKTGSYADDIFMEVPEGGYFQVHAGYGFATTGTDQFTITITDVNTDEAEVDAKNYTLTSSQNYLMSDYITAGLKKIRLDHPITPASGSFRLQHMYFIPIQAMPDSPTNLLDVTNASVSGMKIHGTYLTEITAGSYADDIYVNFEQGGYFQVHAGYGWQTAGTDNFTITITDVNSSTDEVDAKNFVITSAQNYLMTDYVTAGLKKIRLYYPGPTITDRFRLENMYFDQIPNLPITGTSTLNLNQLGAVFNDCRYEDANANIGYIKNGSYADNYIVYNESAGIYALKTNIPWYSKSGTFKITITDIATDAVEVYAEESSTITGEGNVELTLNDRITTGLKKIRFDFVHEGESGYLFNINNVSFYTLTLTYDDNGGSGGPGSELWAPSATNYLSTTEPTRAGYSFAGWNEEEDGSGATTYAAGDAYTMPATDQTLYAQWTPVTLHFTGSTYDWFDTRNWSPACIPTIEHDVIIQNKATLYGPYGTGAAYNTGDATTRHAKAKSIVIDKTASENAKIEIWSEASLIVAENITVKKEVDEVVVEGQPTTPADLKMETSVLGNGGLICGSASTNTQATYDFYSKAYKYGKWYINQYVGIPFSSMDAYQLYGFNIYEYNDVKDMWTTPEGSTMVPWKAYNPIRKYSGSGTDYDLTGTLNLPGTTGDGRLKALNCAWRTGEGIPASIDNTEGHQDYMFANSWTAPIHIDAMTAADFTNMVQTIYIFNAGYVDPEESQKALGDLTGQWSSFPIASAAAGLIDNPYIPSTQAFCVTATDENAKLTLDYKKHVYDPAIAADSINIFPTRAPRRNQEDMSLSRIRIIVRKDSTMADQLYIFEREDFNESFDNGWDGHKVFGNATAPQLYTKHGNANYAVDAVPDLEGTAIGFQKGSEDNVYTFSFEYNGIDTWYLNDLQEQTSTLISTENNYTFTSLANDIEARFIISATPIANVPTGVENINGRSSAVRKVMLDDVLYIIRGGRIYDVTGKLVK